MSFRTDWNLPERPVYRCIRCNVERSGIYRRYRKPGLCRWCKAADRRAERKH